MQTLKTDIATLDVAIERLQKNRRKLNDAVYAGIKEIEQKVYSKLIENMEIYKIDSQRILASTRVYNINKHLFIDVNTTHAIFLEYGTGIMGKQNPHPKPSRNNWIYDTGGKGYSGWWYPTTKDAISRYPHQITSVIDGQLYAFTRGQPSRPFVYKTWLYATKIVTPIIRKHIRRALS